MGIRKKTYSVCCSLSLALMTLLLILVLPSCSEDNWLSDDVSYKALTVEGILYYGPETFITISKDPLIEIRTITNPDYECLENFVLKVQNSSGKTKVKSIEISINGVPIVTPADFKRNVSLVVKQLPELTESATMEVRLEGTKSGCFIELLIEGSPKPSVPIIFNPNLTYGSVSDIDGNTYKTIQIGDLIWMAENLKTTSYKDGTAIPLVADPTIWAGLTSPGYCWYNNSEACYRDTYGALYNWYAVATDKLCPTGWHVSKVEEWNVLAINLGGASFAGGKMKEVELTHWLSPNIGATNESGFTGLPGGYRNLYAQEFYGMGSMGYWWTSSLKPSTVGATPAYYYRGLHSPYNFIDQSLSQWIEDAGLFVRCVKDMPEDFDGDTYSIAEGDCNDSDPSIHPGASEICEDGIDQDCDGYDLICKNPIYGDPVVDIDGNSYKTILIGDQWWMAENLKATKYNDGVASIPMVTDRTVWANLTTPSYCFFANDATNKDIYGALYNWYTVNAGNLCPVDWHIPTDYEWTILTDYLATHGYGYGGSGVDIAKSMAAISYWQASGEEGTIGFEIMNNNASGFSALPGGYRDSSGDFLPGIITRRGAWWSSTESSASNAKSRSLIFDSDVVPITNYRKELGLSIRCIKNN